MAGQMRQQIRKVFASNHLLLSRYLHIVHSIFIYSSLWFSFLFFKENKKNKKFFHLFSILSHELSCYLSSLTGSNHSLIIKWNVNTENEWLATWTRELELLSSSTTGMSNWRPAGHMRPLSSFCAARIGIFIMLQFNPFAHFNYNCLIFYNKHEFRYL